MLIPEKNKEIFVKILKVLYNKFSSNVPIMCLIDASSRVATNHHDDLDLFPFLFSNRMLLDK